LLIYEIVALGAQ